MFRDCKLILVVFCCCLIWLKLGFASDTAQTEPKPPLSGQPADTSVNFHADKKGNLLKLDFNQDIKSVSDPDLLFSHMANRTLIIYYFSAKCMHCQKIIPFFQQLTKDLEALKVTAIAIAVKNNSEDDIRDFIRLNNLTVPVFHDHKRVFSSYCGTGRVPLVIGVNKHGNFIRFPQLSDEQRVESVKASFAAPEFLQ